LQKLLSAVDLDQLSDADSEGFDVAALCLKSVVGNESAMLSKGADALLSANGFAQLVAAACGTSGKLRRNIIDVFNALCYQGSKYLAPKSLDPALGTNLRRLYWAEYTASDA
jgi:hypothetical protein